MMKSPNDTFLRRHPCHYVIHDCNSFFPPRSHWISTEIIMSACICKHTCLQCLQKGTVLLLQYGCSFSFFLLEVSGQNLQFCLGEMGRTDSGLVPRLREKLFCFSPLHLMVAAWFLWLLLLHIEEVPFYSKLTESFLFFNQEWILHFVKCFFCVC